ncbi:MAG: hypothetical protein ACK5LJ_07430 [Paracoccus sp. (in: a-proteobacteria)]
MVEARALAELLKIIWPGTFDHCIRTNRASGGERKREKGHQSLSEVDCAAVQAACAGIFHEIASMNSLSMEPLLKKLPIAMVFPVALLIGLSAETPRVEAATIEVVPAYNLDEYCRDQAKGDRDKVFSCTMEQAEARAEMYELFPSVPQERRVHCDGVGLVGSASWGPGSFIEYVECMKTGEK